MIVLCNGMQRSGSTWSYNVCVNLLRLVSPSESIYSGYHEELRSLLESLDCEYDHLVIKSHTLDSVGRMLGRLGCAKVIYTCRDAYDAIASYMAMFGRPFEEALAAIRDSLLLREFHLKTCNVLEIHYESLTKTPRDRIVDIAAYLGLTAPGDIVEQVHAQTSAERMKALSEKFDQHNPESLVRQGHLLYDRHTLLHEGHIRHGGTGYGRALLTAEQQKRVQGCLGSFQNALERPATKE